MSLSDFQQITVKSETGKAERLFRAAVSAFCLLPRPSRREIAQLEDLTLPLFRHVSTEAKRYVAAALSECAYPPVSLVKRLANETVDIAAPLLIRSVALTDVDLIVLIGRHGHDHARAIARRQDLNPAIADLAAAIERKVVRLRESEPNGSGRQKVVAVSTGSPRPTCLSQHVPGEAEENARRRLRAMMQPSSPLISPSGRNFRTIYDRLRETVLSGHAAFFQTALADALGKDFGSMREVSDSPSYAWLLDALRVLDVGDEKAFLVTAALYPALFGDLQAIRLFLLQYAAINRDEASKRIANWSSQASESSTDKSSLDSRAAG